MKRSLRFLLPLAVMSGVIAFAVAQSPDKKAKKRVLVCTVTTGFRHSSIPFAEKTLAKIGNESGAFEVVAWSKQPDVNVPKKPQAPNKPKDLPANADDKAKTKYEQEVKRFADDDAKYQKALAAWTPEKEAEAKAAQAKWDEQLKTSLAQLSPANLDASKIDAVIFANTTGDLPLPDREGFIKWVENGHGFCAMHSGSDTFHGFPGYNNMLQGEFETHGAQVPANLVKDDPSHPATAGLPDQWDLKQEEMYVIKNQDRTKVRTLWHLPHHPNKSEDAKYYAVSWCRDFGKGKVFYTSLGHREDLWSDDPGLGDRKNSIETSKQYQKHILGGIEWALGLKSGSATPNPEVK